jgi:putative membrane-bound dehydrogenase-like protein
MSVTGQLISAAARRKRVPCSSSIATYVPMLVAALGIALPARAADLVPATDFGLRVQRGFEITLFADNDLVPDTWCMTIDAHGRVVVANGSSIRTLSDDDGDGEADRTVEFAKVERGVMGMCFDGNFLYAAADGWLERFEDADGDGVADGAPQRLVPLGFGEHGGHAMRKGPDGWWYLMGGNDTGFTTEKHVTIAGSPIQKPEAGALLRLTPDGGQSEIIAHGFRNPYDFDFNALGDIFTYDSDVEADNFLPWYFPTRIYHAGYGQHHGWRLTGYKRSWPRPDYYADTVPILARAGRGSPTGVTCYRHFQFPEDYNGGLFLADWTFGRIYFLPLEENGASYSLDEPDVFIEPIGTQGFAPNDIAVGAEGSLYISIGGRKTRGAVYQVSWAGTTSPLAGLGTFTNPDMNNVLVAPQPLDAWSRALWMPAATRLGAQPLAQVVSDETVQALYRVRAIEVLTEMFGGVPAPRARVAAQSSSPLVRARMAWSLGRLPGENAPGMLIGLALDSDAAVRRTALDAIADRITLFEPADLTRVLQQGLAHVDKYVRLAAARVGSRLDNDSWSQITTTIPRNSPAVNAAAVAQAWRAPDQLIHPSIVPALTNLMAQNSDPNTRLEAIRLLILALGDWHLNNPAVEVHTAYELPTPPGPQFDVPALRRVARTGLGSGNALLDMEAARLLAMLEDDEKRTPVVLAGFITPQSTASSDFHYLACISRLKAPISDLSPRLAAAILALDQKLGGQETRVKQNWNVRLVEVVQQLVRREPSLGHALMRHAQFTTPAHVFLAHALEGEQKNLAARNFLEVVKMRPTFPWTSELVSLLLLLPSELTTPVFRQHWNNYAIRDEILPRLAEHPIAADRAKFLSGLGSAQPSVVQASLAALLKLPSDISGTNLVAPLRLLNRVVAEPAEQPVRAQLVTLFTNSLKRTFPIQEPVNSDPVSLRKAYQPLFDYLAAQYPGLFRFMSAEDNDDPVKWNATLRTVRWNEGNAERGADIFAQRACASCHRAAGQLGPDLAGAAQRFSPEDLMNAIVFPSRDIAPPYRTTTFRLRNGESYTGIVAFESADGWIVQTGPGSNVRVNSADLVSRTPSTVSVMPSGLLKGLSPREIADLYAFLRSLQAR